MSHKIQQCHRGGTYVRCKLLTVFCIKLDEIDKTGGMGNSAAILGFTSQIPEFGMEHL